MPIKPENKSRYPDGWKKIRESILERAAHACEQCKAPNHAMIARGDGPDEGIYLLAGARAFCAQTGKDLGPRQASGFQSSKSIKVILTIAHLDHVPERCEPENLRAWCQRCHLRHDAAHHAQNAKLTREAKALAKQEAQKAAAMKSEARKASRAQAKAKKAARIV